DSGGSNPAGTPAAGNTVTFTADIHPLLVAACGRCHSSGNLPRFAGASVSDSYSIAVRLRNDIVEEIVEGDMPADTCNGPPGSPGCVSTADLALIRQWIAAGSPE
ncbi:MAG TPA: hypothetical protein VFS67_37305, partial [Polyangiaceae bacterium]|nr:hypothetical protein [Polyangiaceae bacterium]